jgi:hypothetical protein
MRAPNDFGTDVINRHMAGENNPRLIHEGRLVFTTSLRYMCERFMHAA